jgi:hypothetical protein
MEPLDKCRESASAKRDREFLERVIDERDRIYAERYKAIEKLIDERDKQYEARFKAADTAVDSRFKASDIAVSAALAAQEKAVAAAFVASKEAIGKAETAQKEYNERSNEFRGQLDDQAKTLMPRPETLSMFRAIEDKLASVQTVLESKLTNIQANAKSELEGAKLSFEKNQSTIETQIHSLREAKAQGTGKGEGVSMSWGILLGAIGLIATLLSAGSFIYSLSKQAASAPPQVIYAVPPK